MEEQKPKSIKTIGLLVAIFSGFIIFSNGMGALAWSAIGMGDGFDAEDSDITDPISFLLSNYLELCLTMMFIGVAYLIGGIYIRKYKMWANNLVSGLSVLLFLIIWVLMIAMSFKVGLEDGMAIFSIGAIFTAAFWSTPILLLIRFLNREKIKKHFA